jgi:cell wall-associated NlpC family hydrolase
MRTLKIPFPDIAYYEKTRLANPDEDVLTQVAGSQIIYVRNPAGILVGDFLILDAFESEDAEIVQVASVDSTQHLVELTNPTNIDHAVGVIIIKTPYDKLRVYRGTSTDVSTHTEITTSPYESLRPDNAYSYYTDTTGWYSNATQDITLSDQTIYVQDASGCPALPFTAFLGNEQVRVTAISGNTLTVERAYGYTTPPLVTLTSQMRMAEAVAHPIGTPIFVYYYSYSYYNSSTTLTGGKVLYQDLAYDTILTVTQLKNWFMFGLDLTDDDGYPFPNSMFEFAIRAAIRSLEKTLQVKLLPTQIMDEMHDYYMIEYRDFAFIQLKEYPILAIDRVAIRYPTATSDVVFPNEWINMQKAHGQIHLIPTSGSLSQILMGTGGDYLNFVWRGWTYMPNLWHIDYTAGFALGQVPEDVIGIIGRMACFYPLNIAGDLVGGIAIASKSLGIDGLSQSINTTSSPENAGYSARLRQYERELKVEVPRLIAWYKGLRMTTA